MSWRLTNVASFSFFDCVRLPVCLKLRNINIVYTINALSVCVWGTVLKYAQEAGWKLFSWQTSWGWEQSSILNTILLWLQNRDCIYNTSLCSLTYYRPNKLECFTMASLSNLVLCNTLTYWADTKVTKKMRCCEYGPWFMTSAMWHEVLNPISPWLICQWLCPVPGTA